MISTFIQIFDGYFFKTVEISFHASLIIGVLLIIRPLIKSYLPPRWVYALWFIVVARLLLVEVPSLPQATNPALQSSLAVVQSINLENSLPPAAQAVTWSEALAVVWFLGAAGLLFHFGFGNFRWSQRLAKAHDIQTPEICRLLEECDQEMGVRQVRLVQLPGFASPSMTGLFQPVIILPEDFLERFSLAELRWILLHELAHLKRRDLPVQLLCQVLQAVHWFNPLVWLAFTCFRCDRELACDAHVLDRQAPKTSCDYGHALIKVAETYPRSFLSPGFLGISEEKTDLHERVEKISQYRRPALMWITSGASLCVLLAFVFLTRQAEAAPAHSVTAKIQLRDNSNALAETAVIQTTDVVLPTIYQLRLDKIWAKRFGSNESVLTPAEIMDHMSKILAVNLENPDAKIIDVTIRDDEPKEAADIANALVDNYKAMRDREANVRAKSGLDSLKEQITEQEKVVDNAKTASAKLPNDVNARHEFEHQQAILDALNVRLWQVVADLQLTESFVQILERAY